MVGLAGEGGESKGFLLGQSAAQYSKFCTATERQYRLDTEWTLLFFAFPIDIKGHSVQIRDVRIDQIYNCPQNFRNWYFWITSQMQKSLSVAKKSDVSENCDQGVTQWKQQTELTFQSFIYQINTPRRFQLPKKTTVFWQTIDVRCSRCRNLSAILSASMSNMSQCCPYVHSITVCMGQVLPTPCMGQTTDGRAKSHISHQQTYIAELCPCIHAAPSWQSQPLRHRWCSWTTESTITWRKHCTCCLSELVYGWKMSYSAVLVRIDVRRACSSGRTEGTVVVIQSVPFGGLLAGLGGISGLRSGSLKIKQVQRKLTSQIFADM